MKIDIISDTVCPWCFIGKRRLERALAMRPNITAKITWHPFQLNPEMPPDGIERQIYLKAKFGSSERAKDNYRAVDQASVGEKLDLQLDDIKRMPNSLQSHRLLHYARRHDKQDVVAEHLFQSYFFYGIDIGSIAHLIKIADHIWSLVRISNWCEVKTSNPENLVYLASRVSLSLKSTRFLAPRNPRYFFKYSMPPKSYPAN